jgi:hypothetical protein
MLNYETVDYENDIGAGGLQDVYALIVFGKEYKGTFVDIGCRHPVNHNNTYLLEKYGWKGYAVDLEYFTPEWKQYRPNTTYQNLDAFTVNYERQFAKLNSEPLIDFLSIDLEVPGERFNILKRVFETGYEFKVITIEHDAYCHPPETEMIPQREFLTSQGYTLVRKCDVIEDFWINPKYIEKEQYEMLITYNDGNPEIHPWKYLKGIEYDWTHFYDKIDLQNL